jgi:hypothetical protein
MDRSVFPALALALTAGLLAAQEAGHGTLPTRGAGARGEPTTSTREQDPVVARIEELRKSLEETARLYKKAKDPTRAEMRAALLDALARATVEVKRAREIVAGGPGG